MPGEAATGFWSYTHDDNEAEGGRIRRLAKDIVAAYELRTADRLELFVDSMSIQWGDDWEQRVNTALAGTVFFIPILTPRFFRSKECRRELIKFAQEAKRLGVSELLMPILYVDVPGLDDPAVEDEAMSIVRRHQYEDLRIIRLEEVDSSEYRKAVDRLAAQLVERAETVTQRADAELLSKKPEDGRSANQEDEPGFLDRMATGERAFSQISETMQRLGEEIQRLASLAEEATRDSEAADQRGRGFAGRLAVAEQLARQVKDPAERIGQLGQTYASELVDSDGMILALLEGIESELDELSGPEMAEARELVEMIQGLAAEAKPALRQLSGLVDALGEASQSSRSLRKPLRTAREGLQGVLDGEGVIEEWARRASQIPLDEQDTGPES